MAKPPVKAQDLADVLSDEIRSGALAVGAWLPAERQLAERHEVGRSTVRQAIQMLADRGLVEVVSGSGVRVVRAGRTTDAVGDGSDLRGELSAIRDELRQINERLAAIEARAESPGGP